MDGAPRATARPVHLAALTALALAAPVLALAQAGSVLSVASSRPRAATNQPITYTAIVTAASPATGTPTGTVLFKDGRATLGSGALAGGVATFTVRSLPKGTHAVVADYLGEAEFLPASGGLAGGQLVADTPPVAGAGQAIHLDGATQHARVEDPSGALDGAMTVELWFQAELGPGDGTACLVQQGEGGGLRFGLCLSAARDALVVRRGFETTVIPIAAASGWHHLALAAGEIDTLVYLDGAVFSPLLGTLRSRTRQPLIIGGAPLGAAATDRFAGALDELRLWSTTRTAAELEASARQPVGGGTPGLLGLWRMDEGAGPSLFDAAPAHLEAVLAAPSDATWAPSGAWTRRTITAPRLLLPFVAGYDADGDPFSLTVATPAAHGMVTVAGDAAGYLPGWRFDGVDAFTCQVSNGGPASRYLTEVAVPAPVSCRAGASCAASETCLDGVCLASAAPRTGAGGCGSSGQDRPAGLLLILLLARGLRFAGEAGPRARRRP